MYLVSRVYSSVYTSEQLERNCPVKNAVLLQRIPSEWPCNWACPPMMADTRQLNIHYRLALHRKMIRLVTGIRRPQLMSVRSAMPYSNLSRTSSISVSGV
ncbi:hypothetical protein PBRA_009707 [Plasmodiophora brassicae]|uniref:C2H2-type domain-containing protein n=1 Tax=Plasmodiophora brassicae TaxID=37360 RepID=A0A0G4IL59_PLABS|nr:hypothetical protein PBRA_009707 [Plasmodiophora brassicae]